MNDLELSPGDLKEEYLKRVPRSGGAPGPILDQAISSYQVTFDKLTTEAQRMVGIRGRGCFYSWDRMTHQVVYPPKHWKDPLVEKLELDKDQLGMDMGYELSRIQLLAEGSEVNKHKDGKITVAEETVSKVMERIRKLNILLELCDEEGKPFDGFRFRELVLELRKSKL